MALSTFIDDINYRLLTSDVTMVQLVSQTIAVATIAISLSEMTAETTMSTMKNTMTSTFVVAMLSKDFVFKQQQQQSQWQCRKPSPQRQLTSKLAKGIKITSLFAWAAWVVSSGTPFSNCTGIFI